MGLEIIKKYLNPKSILDIGANVGQFYKEMKLIFPNSYYFLIEGNESCEDALRSLDVDYSISLLSDTEKEVDFYIRKYEPRCTGNSIYREKTSFYNDDQILIQKKRTSTLTDIIKDNHFDFIKIDVQGSELDIINGAKEIFRSSFAILMEISLIEYNENSPSKVQVYKFMEELGFLPVEIVGNINHPITHLLIQQDVLFLNKDYDNSLAI